jgi:putative serine protease PepD
MTAAPGGLRVAEVSPGGFAEAAGLRPGDLLVRIAAGPVFGLSDVGFVERAYEPGTELDVEYVRGDSLLRGRARLSEAFYTSRQNRAA